VVAVAAGSEHALALKSNGIVTAWGYNFTPGLTNVPSGLINVVAIAAGAKHCLALLSNGRVAAWGSNAYGQTNVPTNLSNVVAIAVGYYHSIALKTDGTLVTWGARTAIGNYPNLGQSLVPAGLRNVVAIAGGETDTLAVTDLRLLSLSASQPVKSNSLFNFPVRSFNNHVYSLEYKDSLEQSNWSLAGLAAGNGGLVTLMDSQATNSERFYRAREW
jgi:alpha-tubulin suppressor-like RCC1 family protein